MTERIIHEVKFIETDDGYKIEIKGDKDRIKKMVKRFGIGSFPGMGFDFRNHIGIYRGNLDKLKGGSNADGRSTEQIRKS